jgi:hypothetical protein
MASIAIIRGYDARLFWLYSLANHIPGLTFYHQPPISRLWQGIVDGKRSVLGKIRRRTLVYHAIDLS